ncbi:hypothetical protein SAMN05216436_1389 [bacterium A37T11]|nr:hypothetical protein SAMN05216436_1389 [bacterium A37T11]
MKGIALGAVALTVGGNLMAKAGKFQTDIWLYTDGSGDTTTGVPDCNTQPGTCAYRYHYSATAPNNIGAPYLVLVDGEWIQDSQEGQRVEN